MAKKYAARKSPEQIIKLIREADELQAAGVPAQEIGRRLGVSFQTIYRWRQKYSGMDLSQVKHLKSLLAENAKLKKVLADTVLEKEMLKEVARGKF